VGSVSSFSELGSAFSAYLGLTLRQAQGRLGLMYVAASRLEFGGLFCALRP
jgi:hypothetical protein